jgi:glycosyltransferase involved in cell wall biosynthesis
MTQPLSSEFMKTAPLLTIGVPVYNDERYIKGVLDDVLSQELGDFELIISDNCSTDGTSMICKEVAARDPRVKYIRQPRNIGASANFLYLRAVGRGKYFCWAASDDRYCPDYFSRLVAALEQNDHAVSAFSNYHEIDEEGRRISDTICLDYSSNVPAIRVLKFWLDGRRRRDVWIYGVHRTSALRKVRQFRRNWFPRGEGHDSSYVLLTQLLATGLYLHVDADLHKRRLHTSPGRHAYGTMGFDGFSLPIALACAKFYVVIESTIAAYRGSHSFLVASAAFLSCSYQNLLYMTRFGSFMLVNLAAKILTRASKLIAPW